MTQLQIVDQAYDNAVIRVKERRQEVHQRLAELVKRPTDEWSHKDRLEIHNLVKRLLVLVN